MEVLNSCNNYIDAVCVEEGISRNYDKLEDKFFERINSNTTKENHIFEFNDDEPEQRRVSQFDVKNVRASQMK